MKAHRVLGYVDRSGALTYRLTAGEFAQFDDERARGRYLVQLESGDKVLLHRATVETLFPPSPPNR